MGEAQELQLQIIRSEDSVLPSSQSPKDATSLTVNPVEQPPSRRVRNSYKWWFRVSLYAFLLVSGQCVATFLGSFYYDRGGNSKWMATLVQSAGFPVLIPLLIFYSCKAESSSPTSSTSPAASTVKVSIIYIFLGILMAGDNMMYSYGLLYLPLSTYSLLCATQLAFNAFFSFFLNDLKLTPFILNSLVLLTLSSSLLGINAESTDPKETSKGKYIIGFLCTLGASAGYSLWLSLMQLSFKKVIKRETVSAILEMQIYPSLVATCACLIGLYAGGDWKILKGEMEVYEGGKVSYVMTLVWTAITWQISSVGSIGLIFEATSLFSNVVSTIGLPIVPIVSVIFFHDKMNGVKVLALLMSLWGFASYIYQHYIDDRKISQNENCRCKPHKVME